MTIKIPVVSMVPVENSYLFTELTIAEGYTVMSLSDIDTDVLRAPAIMWEVPTREDVSKICRIRKGLYRDFVCVEGKVHSIYGMRAKVSA